MCGESNESEQMPKMSLRKMHNSWYGQKCSARESRPTTKERRR
ncbi:unnamed protein product [Gongylonema pulchrum]|uniref:Uncharacterized protein n=1 Tax=Gongylonema pulchrum TaxID=637853 RepID=A0A3P6TKW7_9BILA|nr:unnamed protein product [Gongylonema pulchrum]